MPTPILRIWSTRDYRGVARWLDRSDPRKAAATAAIIREFAARALAAHSEAERILVHARTAKARAGWLREYLLHNLQLLGLERIAFRSTALFTDEAICLKASGI